MPTTTTTTKRRQAPLRPEPKKEEPQQPPAEKPQSKSATKEEEPQQPEQKFQKPGEVTGEGEVDKTNIVRGKKINPITGTQTSEDDDEGVWADNVYNEIQLEGAAHTQTQIEPGNVSEEFKDTIDEYKNRPSLQKLRDDDVLAHEQESKKAKK